MEEPAREALVEFPSDVRGAILSYLSQRAGVRPEKIWWRFAQAEGYGDIEGFLERCGQRDGADAERAVRARMVEGWRPLVAQTPRARDAQPASLANLQAEQRPRLVLIAMPDADFASALRCGVAEAAKQVEAEFMGMAWSPALEIYEHLNRLFNRRGVPYRFTDDGLVFKGDQSLNDLTVVPALYVLADERLAGARAEFEDAVTKLRVGGPKDLEDAIEESRKAVESALKVLIDETPRLQRPRQETTDDLVGMLVTGKVVEKQTRDLLTAVARVANGLASHGAGGDIRVVSKDLAVAVVSTAASAITFLAARLPDATR
jgi:hypothetical protein